MVFSHANSKGNHIVSQFYIRASYRGGLEGAGQLTGPSLESAFSVPKDLRGAGVGTNPEELFLGAAAACFLITTAAILKRFEIKTSHLEISSELEVEVGLGITLQKIIHRPTIHLENSGTEIVAKVHEALAIAEKGCFVSKAVKGNATVEVIPTITEA